MLELFCRGLDVEMRYAAFARRDLFRCSTTKEHLLAVVFARQSGKARYFNLLTWWLTLHENIYHQWRNKLIDQETFDSWTRDLEYYANTQHLRNHWPRLKGYFESSFAEHVMALIARQTQEKAGM